jgi:hypothetical protein
LLFSGLDFLIPRSFLFPSPIFFRLICGDSSTVSFTPTGPIQIVFRFAGTKYCRLFASNAEWCSFLVTFIVDCFLVRKGSVISPCEVLNGGFLENVIRVRGGSGRHNNKKKQMSFSSKKCFTWKPPPTVVNLDVWASFFANLNRA